MSTNVGFLAYDNDVIAKAKKSFIPGLAWEDIAQELRISLWRKWPQYNARKASERTFAIRVITSRILDLYRTANRKKRYYDNHSLSLEVIREKELLFFNILENDNQ